MKFPKKLTIGGGLTVTPVVGQHIPFSEFSKTTASFYSFEIIQVVKQRGLQTYRQYRGTVRYSGGIAEFGANGGIMLSVAHMKAITEFMKKLERWAK